MTVINYDVLGISGKGTVLVESLDLKEAIVSSKIPTELVGDWLVMEGGGNTLKDYSGKGNDGVIYGATWTEKDGVMTLFFDGVDDYVEIPHNDVFNSQSFSLEFVFYIEEWDTVDYRNLIAKDAWLGTNWSWSVFTDYLFVGRLWFDFYDNDAAARKPLAISGFETKKWHHVVWVIEAYTRSEVYHNGVSVRKRTDISYPRFNTKPIRIHGIGNKWYIAYLRYFTKALTDTEVQSLYEAVAKVFPLG